MSANDQARLRAEFVQSAAVSDDIDQIYAQACKLAHLQCDTPVVIWAYVGHEFVATCTYGVDDSEGAVSFVAPKFSHSEPMRWVESDNVVAVSVFVNGMNRSVLAAYFGKRECDVEDTTATLTEIANVLVLALMRIDSMRLANQQQRLIELGSLASGIVHEIATPVQFVANNIRFLSTAFERVIADDLISESELQFLQYETKEAIDRSLLGMEHLSEIIAATISAVRRSDVQNMTDIDVNDMLRNVLILSSYQLKDIDDFVTDLADDLPAIRGRSVELRQVFMNLLINAVHTVADARKIRHDKSHIKISSYRQDAWVCVAVEDNGLGIPESIQENVWEQFFTTKDSGAGTGQGLPLVRSIIEQHGGTVSFESGSSGTTFTVLFPSS